MRGDGLMSAADGAGLALPSQAQSIVRCSERTGGDGHNQSPDAAVDEARGESGSGAVARLTALLACQQSCLERLSSSERRVSRLQSAASSATLGRLATALTQHSATVQHTRQQLLDITISLQSYTAAHSLAPASLPPSLLSSTAPLQLSIPVHQPRTDSLCLAPFSRLACAGLSVLCCAQSNQAEAGGGRVRAAVSESSAEVGGAADSCAS